MRLVKSSLNIMIGASFLFACNIMAEPFSTEPLFDGCSFNRIYEGIPQKEMMANVIDVFKRDGFEIFSSNEGVLAKVITEWSVREKGKSQGARIEERRRYRANFDTHLITGGKYRVTLDLQVEQRASDNDPWEAVVIDYSKDKEYQNLLLRMDESVRNSGAMVILLEVKPL